MMLIMNSVSRFCLRLAPSFAILSCVQIAFCRDSPVSSFAEVTAYNHVVISSGPSLKPATLSLQLDPSRDLLVQVSGKVAAGHPILGIALAGEQPIQSDKRSGTGLVWTWRLKGIDEITIVFSSDEPFRFVLESVKAVDVPPSMRGIPFSKISEAP